MAAHDIRIPVSMKERLNAGAVGTGRSQSNLIARVVREYGAGDPVPVPSEEPQIDQRFHIEDEAWDSARARAQMEGVSLSQVVRERLDEILPAASSIAGQ